MAIQVEEFNELDGKVIILLLQKMLIITNYLFLFERTRFDFHFGTL